MSGIDADDLAAVEAGDLAAAVMIQTRASRDRLRRTEALALPVVGRGVAVDLAERHRRPSQLGSNSIEADAHIGPAEADREPPSMAPPRKMEVRPSAPIMLSISAAARRSRAARDPPARSPRSDPRA